MVLPPEGAIYLILDLYLQTEDPPGEDNIREGGWNIWNHCCRRKNNGSVGGWDIWTGMIQGGLIERIEMDIYIWNITYRLNGLSMRSLYS